MRWHVLLIVIIRSSEAFVILSRRNHNKWIIAAQSSDGEGDALSADPEPTESTQDAVTDLVLVDDEIIPVERLLLEDEESIHNYKQITSHNQIATRETTPPTLFSRREWWKATTAIVTTSVVTGITAYHYYHDAPPIAKGERIAPVNFTQVVRESRINIAIHQGSSSISLDPITLQKKKVIQLPAWIPERWVPRTKIIKNTTDSEVLIAAVIAGTVVEMARTSLLYPLLTLKTRVQTDINRRQRKVQKRLRLRRRLRVLESNIVRHFKEGNLYAGLMPTLMVTAPATGLYYGIRDISERTFAPLPIPELYVAVAAAFLGSVVSIAFRSPVDALSARLQVATGEEGKHHFIMESVEDERIEQEEREERVREKVGNWFLESMERLPALVVTEIPYLISRIVLNGLFIQGTLNLGHYELVAVSTAIICGILTTPFDVARTRILLDSDNDPTNGIDGGSGEGLIKTFQTIVGESNDGYANLFRGWFERALYLGIGRAWVEPLQLLGYVALRDAILLEWFN
ncbi:hypothetical protein FisN_6Hh113 [Fistulifera solaris]|uniref:Uncharacterized protein n=1 Tax=Fistulifera solaris TaxID=1519565 RepID=A0A1Z5KHW3_FISSO|nr:hypothetical protein FisN_6Hh113 [Fistulifera solaris]|eukprot:GAX25849.1 hypothetical protein FisN_6Hh113 [Fistulifera solaris]